MKKFIVAAGLLAVTGFVGSVQADVVEGAFTPEATEDFEGFVDANVNLGSLFGGTVPLSGAPGMWAQEQNSWSVFYGLGLPVVPTSGNIFGVIAGSGIVRMDFAGGGVFGFGGNGTHITPTDPNADFTFFDADNNVIGNFSLLLGSDDGDGTMTAFSFVSDIAIAAVEIRGQETAFDDLTITSIPAPGALALLGLAGLASRRRRRA